ncbi:hypothetical protein HLB44_29365 [Aquincola sp. S2]|uniref:MSHA biogenesis protein MshJ n=1 Tax=Pseudaquabacterium terrae TaxID=2732868 RepID=A0ABX2ER82_9BURK|nr:hypothetical protein [Aquabacterium terrae]NRF71113.1 hypothetical protein [Aquabacterium terrae]
MSGAIVLHDRVCTALARGRRRFDARAARERLLLIAASLALLGLMADFFLLRPALADWSAARARHAVAVAALQRAGADEARRVAVEQQLARDVAQGQARVDHAAAELRALRATLVAAPEMGPLLARLLSGVAGVQVRSMLSLGPTEAAAAGAGAPAAATPLYRHGVELVLEGRYADLLGGLQAIEALPQRMLWGGLRLQVEQHPTVVLTVRLYTLSEQRSWLEL